MNKKIPIALSVLSLVAAMAAVNTVAAATAAYVKYEGVDGESKDMDHEGWIDLVAISQPLHEPGSSSAPTRRRGDVVLEDIVIEKEADKASAKLAEAVCKGKVFPKVEIHLTASDSTRTTYYTYELKNVRVSSYSVGGAGSSEGGVPLEQISLNFEEIKVSYAQPRGKAKGKVETSWKVEKGE
jgi:type VI secretion system secreted protein Hcp